MYTHQHRWLLQPSRGEFCSALQLWGLEGPHFGSSTIRAGVWFLMGSERLTDTTLRHEYITRLLMLRGIASTDPMWDGKWMFPVVHFQQGCASPVHVCYLFHNKLQRNQRGWQARSTCPWLQSSSLLHLRRSFSFSFLKFPHFHSVLTKRKEHESASEGSEASGRSARTCKQQNHVWHPHLCVDTEPRGAQ